MIGKGFWQKRYLSKHTGAEIDAAVDKAAKLPAVTGADEGKVLTVDDEGNIVAGEGSGVSGIALTPFTVEMEDFSGAGGDYIVAHFGTDEDAAIVYCNSIKPYDIIKITSIAGLFATTAIYARKTMDYGSDTFYEALLGIGIMGSINNPTMMLFHFKYGWDDIGEEFVVYLACDIHSIT